MSTSTIVRGSKIAGAVAAGIVIAASVGPASAATVAGTPIPAAAPADPAPVTAVDAMVVSTATVAEPASWRQAAITTGATLVATQTSRQASARQALVAKQAKFTAFTLTSAATRDMRGVESSLYHGKYYTSASEAKRLCIVRRESEGHYDVVNPTGSYRGAYQVSAALARGATWMMLPEHRKLMGDAAAKRVLASLRGKPMNTWPRYWQDAAFHTIINYSSSLSGAKHWAGGRWHC